MLLLCFVFFFFSSRRRHTRCLSDWSSDVCSSDLYISERLEDRIAAKLGYPETDPHGHIIPEKDGIVAEREETTLSKWPCEVPAVISSVSDRDPNALREMKRMGLVPGTRLVVEPGTRQASLLVRIGEQAPTRLR